MSDPRASEDPPSINLEYSRLLTKEDIRRYHHQRLHLDRIPVFETQIQISGSLLTRWPSS